MAIPLTSEDFKPNFVKAFGVKGLEARQLIAPGDAGPKVRHHLGLKEYPQKHKPWKGGRKFVDIIPSNIAHRMEFHVSSGIISVLPQNLFSGDDFVGCLCNG